MTKKMDSSADDEAVDMYFSISMPTLSASGQNGKAGVCRLPLICLRMCHYCFSIVITD